MFLQDIIEFVATYSKNTVIYWTIKQTIVKIFSIWFGCNNYKEECCFYEAPWNFKQIVAVSYTKKH